MADEEPRPPSCRPITSAECCVGADLVGKFGVRGMRFANATSMETARRAQFLKSMVQFVAAVPWRPETIGAAVGLVAFQRFMRFSIVTPTNVTAFAAGDWGTHMMGWLQYRQSPMWGLPLGQVPTLGYPLGTSVVFTDSIPIVGLVLRSFSSVLPTNFQYLGVWMLASFVLQGAIGARIVSMYVKSSIGVAGGAALFVLTPALLTRVGHPALTAHWTILIVVCAALKGARRSRWGLVGFVVVTPLIQPYLWLLVIVLLAGLLLDDARRGASSGRGALLGISVAVFGSVAVMALVGTFSSGYQASAAGFGEFSANVLTFLNAAGRSRLWPDISTPAPQYEGYAFLGSGVLLLLAVVVILHGRKPRLANPSRLLRSDVPVLTMCAAIFLFFYALSFRVFVGSHQIVNLAWLYSPVMSMAERFRTSGRAVWPLMYLVVAAAIIGLRKCLGRWTRRADPIAACVLVACSAVQYFDLDLANQYDASREYWVSQSEVGYPDGLSDARWELLGDAEYQHMTIVPPALYGCADDSEGTNYSTGRVALLSLEAYQAGLTFNSGFFSRIRTGQAESCAQQTEQAEHQVNPDTVYILTGDAVIDADARCGELDGLRVCVAPTNPDSFARSLE